MGNPIHGGRRRVHDDAHGLLPREATILARTDAGTEPGVVAREMGCSLAAVVRIVNRYSFGVKSQQQRERLIRAATQRLAAAARATGGRFA